MDVNIAILVTCYNRRALTERCLSMLRQQPLFDPRNLFLVDDGSTDGTGDMVRTMFPDAHVIDGSGDLFWNGGMRLAWEHAVDDDRTFDHYLWLNDDVVLHPGTLANMIADADAVVAVGAPVIVAGSTIDPATQTVNYGGHRRPSARRPLRLAMIEPTGSPQRVDTVSGNVVLVSKSAERLLGNLSPTFEHIYGDLDYGYRATAAGVPIFLASRVAGECDSNSISGSSIDTSLGRWQRLRTRMKEDRKVHARDWRRFARLHSGLGPLSILYSVTPYLRIIART